MIYLIGGTSHSGKTNLAHKLMNELNCPYYSIDHLKMGLIRSKQTNLTPLSSEEKLTNYLWPIIVEIIKTAIENDQDLIIEGCYIPTSYKSYFDSNELEKVKCLFLVFEQKYINSNFNQILKYASVIEKRVEDSYDINECISDNIKLLASINKHNVNSILIKGEYNLLFSWALKYFQS